MTYPVGPFPLTAGVETVIQYPTSAPVGAVRLANLSSYLCTLSLGGGLGQQWLLPWEENIYPTSGGHGQIVITPQLLAYPGSTAQVTATFYDRQEIPQGAWPVSLAGPAASSTAQVQQVAFTRTGGGSGSGTWTAGASSLVLNKVFVSCTNFGLAFAASLTIVGVTSGTVYGGPIVIPNGLPIGFTFSSIADPGGLFVNVLNLGGPGTQPTFAVVGTTS